tara:strand:+ start:504 stop:887 length:384 start_codon:yes stop_codon:yes gene_type:complete
MAKKTPKTDDKDGVSAISLGIQLGDLPRSTVDAMFAGLSWEAESGHGLSVKAAVAAVFASARVEAEIMADTNVQPRDRLLAAKQFKQGFMEACRMVSEPVTTKLVRAVPSEDTSIPTALENLYADAG